MTGVRFREDTGFEGKCAVCRQWWPLDAEFWKPKHGLRRCMDCWRAYHRASEMGRRGDGEIRSVIRSNARMAYWLNRDARLAGQRAWRAANREHVAEYNRKWRAANKEKVRASSKDYYDDARDVILTKKRAAYRDRTAA